MRKSILIILLLLPLCGRAQTGTANGAQIATQLENLSGCNAANAALTPKGLDCISVATPLGNGTSESGSFTISATGVYYTTDASASTITLSSSIVAGLAAQVTSWGAGAATFASAGPTLECNLSPCTMPAYGAAQVSTDGTNWLVYIAASVGAQAANTVLANVSASAAAPTAASIPSGIQNYVAGTGYNQASGHQLQVPLACHDSSGSGTAQSCSTGGTTYTPAAYDCVVYSTTTANSGTGLTVNIDSLGAKSVAIPGSSGWTTTLTASIVPAGKPALMCYDGTNWDLMQTGTAASGGGGSSTYAPWNITTGSGIQGATTAAPTVNTIYVSMIPNGPGTGQYIGNLQYQIATADSTAGHYYDIGIYGPCALGAASCALDCDFGTGSEGIAFSSTGVKENACTQGTVQLAATTPTNKYYFFAVTGNATTAQLAQLFQGFTLLNNGVSSTASTNGQMPSAIEIPAINASGANMIGIAAIN